MNVLLALLLFAPLSAVALWFGCWWAPVSERAWLRNVALFAFGARIAVATLFALIPGLRFFHEDADGYEYVGLALAAAWHNTGPPFGALPDLNYGYFYFAGAVYYVFGAFPAMASYVNALIGTVTALLVYRLARLYFHRLVARRATLLVAFFPSMILWSSMATKDPAMSILIVICLSSCVRLKQKFSVVSLLGVLLPMLAMQPIRFYMVYFIAFSVMVSMTIERGANLLNGVYKQIFVAAIGISLFVMVGLAAGTQAGVSSLTLERASQFRRGMAETASSGFNNDADVSTPVRAFLFLPSGLAVLLFGPFPWQFTSARSLLAAPETLAWWLMVPGVVRGIRFSIRRRLSQTSPLLIFAGTLTCGYALVQGNVGSAFRQRAQIFVLLFVFASLGTYVKKCRNAGIPAHNLLSADEA